MKPLPHHTWREFLQDARGVFSAFTLISLLAGFTLVTAPAVSRFMHWEKLSREETSSLTLLYLISALGDALLGIYLNKLPSTLNLDTGGGDASLAAGPGAEATTETVPTEPKTE